MIYTDEMHHNTNFCERLDYFCLGKRMIEYGPVNC